MATTAVHRRRPLSRARPRYAARSDNNACTRHGLVWRGVAWRGGQVHTTGMDIPQGASARAVLTLGKDLTFRDYAQGAYRMRGIGKGQSIVLFLTPEVRRLVATHAAQGQGVTPEARAKALAALGGLDAAALADWTVAG